MKAIVWMVSSGYCSDYRVVAVFSTKEKAEAYAAVLNKAHPRWDSYFVEEIEFDPETPVLKRLYEVAVDINGKEIDRRELELLPGWHFITSSPEYESAFYGSEFRSKLVGAKGVSDRGFDVALKAARDELYKAKEVRTS